MSIPPPEMNYSSPTQGSGLISQDDRTLAMVAYILGIPTSFIGPLIIYLIKKDQSKFIAYHAMQALVFQAAIFIGYMIGGALAVVGIGHLINFALGILSIVLGLIAGLAANRGEWYEIPIVGKFARQQVGL